MTTRIWTRDRSWIARVVAMLLLTGGAAPGHAADAASYRILRGEIRVECPLTVGG